jgi:dCTP deaminase
VIFSDRTIRESIDSGSIQIDPFEPSHVQPSSVDLRVGSGFRIFVNHRYSQIDPRHPQPDLTQLVEVAENEPFMLHPGEFVLGSTLERVKLGNGVVARLEGKSSLGRLGLLIHSTAGFIDPGFEGHITLELSNVATLPIAIYPGMKIGQISFYRMTTEADLPYGSPQLGSKYQGQIGPTASRSSQDFHSDDTDRQIGL